MRDAPGPSRKLPAAALALRPRLEAVCLRLLRHRADAEDAVQTVYRLFLEKEARIDAARLETWLLRTAVLVSKNERRGRARRARLVPPPPQPAPPAEPDRPPLGPALAELPPRLREALSLRYLRERSIPDTAAAVGCPPRTLEKRLRRGLDLLRRLLARRGWLSLPAALAAALGGRRLEACARSAAPGVAVAGLLLLAGSLALRRATADVDSPPGSTATLASDVAPLAAARKTSSPEASSRAGAGAVAVGPELAPIPPFDEFSRRWVRLSNRPRVLENWRSLGIDASLDVLAAAPLEAAPERVAALVFEEWGRRDGGSAAEWLRAVYEALPDGWVPQSGPSGQAPYLGATLLRVWGETSPEAMQAWMADLPAGRTRDWWTAHLILAEAGDPDARPEALFERLDRLPWDTVKLHSTIDLAKSWAAVDAESAAEWIWRRAWPSRSPGSVAHAAQKKPLIDTLTGLAGYSSLPGLVAESWAEGHALSAVIHAWAARDPEGAWTWCRSRPSSPRADAPLGALGYALSERDPRTALRYVERVSDPVMQARWREYIVYSMADPDPEAALAVADRLPPGDDRDYAIHAVLTTTAVRRPEFVADWFARRWSDRLPENPVLRKSADGFVDLWAKEAPRAAAEWLQDRPDPEWRDRKLKDIGATWAAADPAGLAAHADANGFSAAWAPLLASAAVKLWGDNRTAAFRIVDRMPPGPARREAVGAIAVKWAEVDPDASGAWALRRTDASERDAALLGIVRELADQGRPEEADAWVGHLQDEQARAKARDLLR